MRSTSGSPGCTRTRGRRYRGTAPAAAREARARRVLLIQWEFAEDGGAAAQTVTELAEELLRHGHRVEVIAQAPHRAAGVAVPEGMRLTLTSFAGSRLLRRHARAWEQLRFFLAVLRRVPGYARSKDCVITLETPSGIRLLGVLIRRLSGNRVRHVCWVLDMYRDQMLMLPAPVPYPSLLRPRRAADYLAYARASEVVVLGECMRRHLRRQGVRSPITVIPVWQDAERIHRVDPTAIRSRLGLGDRPCLLYAGTATHRHPLLPLVEAARHLPELTLLIVGRGESAAAARELATRQRLGNVRVLPPVARDDVNQLLSAGDLHAAVLDPRATGTCVPSKAYAAMAVGRPVLFVGGPRCQVALDVRAADCGAVVAPEPLSAVIAALRGWLEDPEAWRRRGQNGRRFFLEHREKRLVCNEWLRHI